MSTWVYLKSEPSLWTVGFYRPDGTWEAESDHSSPEQAVERIGFLNGRSSVNRDLLAALEWILRTTLSGDEFRLLVVGLGGVSNEAKALEPRIESHVAAIKQARAAIAAAKGETK